jgi:hypothetical protein
MLVITKTIMFATYEVPSADDAASAGPIIEPSPYELACQAYYEQQELERQAKKHGVDALRGGLSAKTDDGAVRALQLQPKGHAPAKTNWKDPLRDLMKQLQLKPGVDIDTVALSMKQGVQTIGVYDKRGVAPLKNPQKRWALDVPEGAHGLVQKPGSCTGHIGSTSSGKTTSICHQLAVNHATWRYEHVWLLHPDADAALAGEYGLCKGEGVGMKSLDHFPTMDWWAQESPGRTAIVIDDWPLQTLSVKGADKSQKTLADRLLGYYRSHAPKSCDILIGTQQIFNVPTNLRRYVTCWCIYPRRVSPQTYNAIAQVCQLDRSTLKTCLGFCEGDYSFLLVSLVGDERGRVRVNGWRAVHGIL